MSLERLINQLKEILPKDAGLQAKITILESKYQEFLKNKTKQTLGALWNTVADLWDTDTVVNTIDEGDSVLLKLKEIFDCILSFYNDRNVDGFFNDSERKEAIDQGNANIGDMLVGCGRVTNKVNSFRRYFEYAKMYYKKCPQFIMIKKLVSVSMAAWEQEETDLTLMQNKLDAARLITACRMGTEDIKELRNLADEITDIYSQQIYPYYNPEGVTFHKSQHSLSANDIRRDLRALRIVFEAYRFFSHITLNKLDLGKTKYYAGMILNSYKELESKFPRELMSQAEKETALPQAERDEALKVMKMALPTTDREETCDVLEKRLLVHYKAVCRDAKPAASSASNDENTRSRNGYGPARMVD